ncbi:hypothetical protein H072_9386 [Dactylellina haptotyla CBS 200.50]|uniref:F-box domain-containing protein n=1 Tax=Dactylellina haptotyla (strain CBS 200.50) TaxID=1284197 RepID=S8A2P9_DACHA|nr:hypothetical protein H072_9386 [Dactylellina haptotyla CBS 200.50]
MRTDKQCVICGYKTAVPPEAQEEAWWHHVRFVHYDLLPFAGHSAGPFALGINTTSPCVTDLGKVAWEGGTRHQPVPYLSVETHLDDDTTESLAALPSRLMGCDDPDRDASIASACYPVHAFCWELFTSVQEKNALEDSEYTERVKILFKLLGSLRFKPSHLMWEHEYDGGLPHAPSGETMTATTEGYFYNPTIAPGPQEWLSDTWGDFSMDWLPNRPAQIPDLFPNLPSEVIHKVLGFLGYNDLKRLTEMPSRQTVAIPELIWKGFFEGRSDFAFMIPTGDDKDRQWYNQLLSSPETEWHKMCVLAKRYIMNRKISVFMRRRIWDLSVRLSDLIDEIRHSELMAMQFHVDYPFLGQQPRDDLSFHLPETATGRSFIVQMIQLPEETPVTYASETLNHRSPEYRDMHAVSSRGELGQIATDEIAVSFIGRGKSQYVSGLYFYPQGVGIGLINWKRMRRVSLRSEHSKLALSIAVNSVGVVDISVTHTYGFRWLGGGQNLEGAAVARRILTPVVGNKLATMSVVVDLEVYKIKRLGIFSPDIDPTTRETAVVLGNFWTPAPPTITRANKKFMNTDSYYDSDVREVAGADYGSELPDPAVLSHQLDTAFSPFSYIDFGDRLLNRFTYWVEDNAVISGISVIGVDGDGEPEKFVLGKECGVPVDFSLNPERGERIRYLEIITKKNYGDIAGLSVYTTARRRFRLATRREDTQSPVKKPLLPPLGHRITGLYGRYGWIKSYDRCCRLVGLGCISVLDPKIPVSGPTPPLKGFKKTILAENAQYVPAPIPAPEDGPNTLPPHNGVLGKFISVASFDGCKSITAYTCPVERGSPYESPIHLTGVELHYSGKKDEELAGNPRVLGRISNGQRAGTAVLDVENGEHFSYIVVYQETHPVGSSVHTIVTCMELITSTDRVVTLGSPHSRVGCSSWRLGDQKTIVWAFNSETEWVKGYNDEELESDVTSKIQMFDVMLG